MPPRRGMLRRRERKGAPLVRVESGKVECAERAVPEMVVRRRREVVGGRREWRAL